MLRHNYFFPRHVHCPLHVISMCQEGADAHSGHWVNAVDPPPFPWQRCGKEAPSWFVSRRGSGCQSGSPGRTVPRVLTLPTPHGVGPPRTVPTDS